MVTSKIIHDIKSKLSIISMGLNLTKDGEMTKDALKRVTSMMDFSLKSINEMMNDIHVFITDKHIHIKSEKVSLKEFMESCMSDIAHFFSAKSVTVKVDISEDIYVSIDKKRFSRIINNLSKNAAEATISGFFTISAFQNTKSVVLKISDTGQGMSEEVVKNIFRPYATYKSGGVGLGLVNVKEIVEMYGGNIDVQSEVGKGTTFIISLPEA